MDCFPIPFVCFQCGTDQNPCHCKVVGPTLGKQQCFRWPEDALLIRSRVRRGRVLRGIAFKPIIDLGIRTLTTVIGNMLASCVVMRMYGIAQAQCILQLIWTSQAVQQIWAKSERILSFWRYRTDMHGWFRTLGLPVELNGSVSNAIPFWEGFLELSRPNLE